MKRDLRLDFIRGLVLLFIVADHARNNDPWYLPWTMWGYCDAAHAFIFLSGLVCGMVYMRALEQRGLGAAIGKAARRCAQIYTAHILTFTCGFAVVVACGLFSPINLNEFGMQPLVDHPGPAVFNALLLTYTPWIMDVLKMYILLLAALPFMLALYRRSRAAAVGVSLLAYAAAQQWPEWTLPVYPAGFEWFWNPLGWQLVFFGGAWLGAEIVCGRRVVPMRPSFFVLALVGLGGMIVCERMGLLGWRWSDRIRLGPAHVFNFACLAYVVTFVARPTLPLFRWRIAQPVIRCGQLSLQIFCFGVVVDYLISALLFVTDDRLQEEFIIFGAVLIMLCGPYLWDQLMLPIRQATRRLGRASISMSATLPLGESSSQGLVGSLSQPGDDAAATSRDADLAASRPPR